MAKYSIITPERVYTHTTYASKVYAEIKVYTVHRYGII